MTENEVIEVFKQRCYCDYNLSATIENCTALEKEIPDGEKPDWCPLRELPEKKPESEERECIGSTNGTWEVPLYENKGFNACLDEILKECDADGTH